ncbi:polysaccharide pyruvyl transferase family protein [Pacificoceanicola onchidii]|uniref:polysaccharide pyruvyl transferase family protein n=1 Tax=Pacificoceanicola onchidii TaxID=2562685 RepID=UPI0010A5CA65|nr:polysaccharide pyruvyl transferase family protein [Pacificoceanicola onchidii]
MPAKKIVFSYQLLSNIGCEIIIRGSIAFLTRAFPQHDLRFVVQSYHPEEDRALLSDLPNVEVVPMLEWKRYLRGVLRKTGLFVSHWTPRFASARARDADLFVSVGGDIYTMFGDALPEDWLGFESYATRNKIPVMMFGANMERFEILSEGERRTLLDHLKRFHLLVVRDKGTHEYLGGHGIIGNTEVFPDPIFSLRPHASMARTKIKRIGLNFTPFLIKEFGEESVTRFAALTEGLVEAGYEVTYIPHVASRGGAGTQHDPAALETLYKALPPQIAEKVTVYRGEMSFAKIGAVIGGVDLFIGARMHGCLNALTQGKATCFVAYSRKAFTMVDWLKTETPFADVAQSFNVLNGDAVDMANITALIDAHDTWAGANETPVEIDTDGYLQSLPVWEHLSRAVKI